MMDYGVFVQGHLRYVSERVTLHTWQIMKAFFLALLVGVASAADAEVQQASWQTYLTPKNILLFCFILYRLYSKFGGGGGGDPDTKAFGEKFLAENKAKEGVVTLASGLQYKVLRAGHGDGHPLPNTPCACHYEGRCAKDWPTGKKFDSSYDRGSPTTFAPNQVIKGWTEAMQLMVEGDKWEMYIPSNLAYGDNGRVAGCLVFTMEIMKINGGTKPKAKKDD